ncbi:MAG: vanadium-dependent haloperoxidase [Clostridia bacterium]|nr:vanadium-dependent haloperoxidase [Clostridia bacterium]
MTQKSKKSSPDSKKSKNCYVYPPINVPRKWCQLSYAGTERVPPAEDPSAGTWPTYFMNNNRGKFTDVNGNPIAFQIRVPDSSIDFEGRQLKIVIDTLNNITDRQICIAKYWGTGPATKQWTPIIDILIDTYNITAPRASRILAATQAALNDAFVVSWYFKYLWNIARPDQFDQHLATILCTPYHPTYPSGHATVAGCAQMVLSYFFQSESRRLKELAEQCAISRLYAGVHFPIDNEEGLRLGRQIGKIAVSVLQQQEDGGQAQIDYPITINRHAPLPPPPYTQVIPFKGNTKCNSLIINTDHVDCSHINGCKCVCKQSEPESEVDSNCDEPCCNECDNNE